MSKLKTVTDMTTTKPHSGPDDSRLTMPLLRIKYIRFQTSACQPKTQGTVTASYRWQDVTQKNVLFSDLPMQDL